MNIARLLYIGSMKLGYSEDEIFRMTPRKFFCIFEEFIAMNSTSGKTDKCSIDDLP